MSDTQTKIKELREYLELDAVRKEFQSALPEHLPYSKFKRSVMTAVQLKVDLLKCPKQSLMGECMKAASDGLLPDNREATINVYYSKKASSHIASYIPMYQGILKKIRNSGELKSIKAEVVFENDHFQEWTDENGSHFRHEPVRKDRGDIILTYAQAITKDGGVYFEVMDEEDMIEIKNCAKSQNIWKQWGKEMRKKSAIRRLSKMLPMSTDIETTLKRDDDLYDLPGDDPEPEESPVIDTSKPNKLMGALGVGSEPEQSPAQEEAPVESENPAPQEQAATPSDVPV